MEFPEEPTSLPVPVQFCLLEKENMVKKNSGPEVVYDQPYRSLKKHGLHMSSKHKGSTSVAPSISLDLVQPQNEEIDISKLWREIKFIGTSAMSWKERKRLQDQEVANLGGMAPKKQRLPLSVAKGMMKKQKKREQKQLEEALILGKFTRKSKNRKEEKRRNPEDRVLRATEGHLKGGILDVRHLFRQNPPTTSQGLHKHKKGKGKGQGNNKGKSKSRR